MRLIDKIHRDLTSERGKAREHSCVDCGKQARHWSFDGCEELRWGRRSGYRNGYAVGPSPFCVHIEHYSPRCPSCHMRYDRANRDLGRGEPACI